MDTPSSTPVPGNVERLGVSDIPDHDVVCRYCFTGPDEDLGDLISPCSCKGDQKWVHLDCLKRWQRSVLVTQPTHPAFYEHDERQFVCNVCTAKFSIEPPTREELMAGFTGPEIAALIQVGCLIVCEKKTSAVMTQTLAHNSHIADIRSLVHWIKGVYLITSVEEDDGEDGTDSVIGVNLTRSIAEQELPLTLRMYAKAVASVIPNSEITIMHFIGGPCTQSHATGLALLRHTLSDGELARMEVRVIGKQGGLWITGELGDVVAAVMLDQARKMHEIYEQRREEDDGDEQSDTKAERVIVRAFWGQAIWGRTQLLGEIARGGWGMCRADTREVFPEAVGAERSDRLWALWEGLVESGRLALAPKNEMMSDDESSPAPQTREEREEAQRGLEEQMARHREQLRMQLLAQHQREVERMKRVSADEGDDGGASDKSARLEEDATEQ